MMPLHELLSRIRWDPEFGKGRFVIGYADHVAGKLNHVELSDLHIDPENRFMFDLRDDQGATHSIPFHRVKEVSKDGTVIWRREHHAP